MNEVKSALVETSPSQTKKGTREGESVIKSPFRGEWIEFRKSNNPPPLKSSSQNQDEPPLPNLVILLLVICAISFSVFLGFTGLSAGVSYVFAGVIDEIEIGRVLILFPSLFLSSIALGYEFVRKPFIKPLSCVLALNAAWLVFGIFTFRCPNYCNSSLIAEFRIEFGGLVPLFLTTLIGSIIGCYLAHNKASRMQER